MAGRNVYRCQDKPGAVRMPTRSGQHAPSRGSPPLIPCTAWVCLVIDGIPYHHQCMSPDDERRVHRRDKRYWRGEAAARPDRTPPPRRTAPQDRSIWKPAYRNSKTPSPCRPKWTNDLNTPVAGVADSTWRRHAANSTPHSACACGRSSAMVLAMHLSHQQGTSFARP